MESAKSARRWGSLGVAVRSLPFLRRGARGTRAVLGVVLAAWPGWAAAARFAVEGYVEPANPNMYPGADFVLRGGAGGEVRYALDDPLDYLGGQEGSELRCTVDDEAGLESNSVPLVLVTGVAPSTLVAPFKLNPINSPGLWSEVAKQSITLPADTDGDGIPDAYETENGLDPNRDDAGEDLDGDGFDNTSEYVAGTRADDRDSRFEGRLLLDPDTGALRLTWPAVPGRRYAILLRTDLRDAPKILFEGITVNAPQDRSQDVPIIPPRSFFTVRAELEP